MQSSKRRMWWFSSPHYMEVNHGDEPMVIVC
jgi:hypothetical protein